MSDPTPTRGLPWGRFVAEAALIVISVYLAIVLEGISAQRDRRAEAVEGLRQLRSELVLDREDAMRVAGEQRRIGDDYVRLIDWLEHPESMPADSFTAVLKAVAFSNPTAYPRKGAWTALASGGLLSAIESSELVVEIADHYENLVARVEYNGNDYDELLNATMIESAPAAWDALRMRQVGDLTELRGRLDYLATAWNGYYQELMSAYGSALDRLIADLDRYLDSSRPARG